MGVDTYLPGTECDARRPERQLVRAAPRRLREEGGSGKVRLSP